jgi:hypothetical protein
MSCCCKGNLHNRNRKERKNQMRNNLKVKSMALGFVLTLSSVLPGQAQTKNETQSKTRKEICYV